MSKTNTGLVEYALAQLGKRELWRDVVGYEGLYQVSNFGRVKSLNYHRSARSYCAMLQSRRCMSVTG